MTTLASPRALPRETDAGPGQGARLLRSVGIVALWIVGAIGVAILALPVALLFIVTAVPLSLSIPLALTDVALVAAFVMVRRTAIVGLAFVASVVVVSTVGIWLSQLSAYTPAITDGAGHALPNSIAVMEKVKLGGTEQWVTIRGKDRTDPVLLFLAGGPGGSELAHIRNQMPQLEDHFVVVNWDPANAGKSYGVLPWEQVSLDRVVSDARELTLQLRSRFSHDRIYLFGESGGTVIGVRLIQRYPELFAAYVGTGQRTSVHEDDVMGYEFAMKYAAERGDAGTVETLRSNGPPPYTGWNMFWKNAQYLMVLNDYGAANSTHEPTGHDQFGDWLTGPEYGLADRFNVFRGLWEGFTRIYPEHDAIDFGTQATALEVPVYFVQGRYDMVEMGPLLERWFGVLAAPHKEIVWAEHSAHTPNGFEPSVVADVLVNRALAQNPVR
jgi:pimeloyl-ACP methyl ester carboxylesterase